MTTKFSAYLQIYNDWSILEHALRSLVGYVDELVVVDGAYEWMVPYVTALGLDPRKSDERVYAALDRSGLKYRSVNRVWKNQIEKRLAGYAACTHNLIFRVDADEIFFFNDGAIERFLASGAAVGDMQMPTYLAPGWLITRPGSNHPRQCFFFDRSRVTPEQHLNYLWLVLEADKRPVEGEFPFSVYGESLAFNAHLTGWRTADTSASRTAYYNTNWMRGHGVPWLQELREMPLANFDRFFELVPPAAFRQLLDTDKFSLGKTFLEPNEVIMPSEMSDEVEKLFIPVYTEFLKSLERHNQKIISRQQACIQGLGTFLDVTTNGTREIVCRDDRLLINYSVPVHTVHAKTHKLSTDGIQFCLTPAEADIDGRSVVIKVPDLSKTPGFVRQLIEITVWSHSPAELLSLQIEAGSGL